jgi:hypothetical protein
MRASRVVSVVRRAATRSHGLTALLLLAVGATPAAAHHTGVYTPKDNAITTNFKALKFSVQAGKFDVARRLFEEGPLRAEMRARAAALPSGLETGTRAALAAGDAPGVERALMVFFASLARDLAVEGERQLAAGADAVTVGPRFLEAIWRYYNLVDFAVGQRDARASVAMRLAYDDAEGATRAGGADAARLRDALRRMATILGSVAAIASR